jgi:hypothetical protein
VYSAEGPPRLQSGSGLTLSECDVHLNSAYTIQQDPQDASRGLKGLVFPGSGGIDVKFVKGLVQFPYKVMPSRAQSLESTARNVVFVYSFAMSGSCAILPLYCSLHAAVFSVISEVRAIASTSG